MAVRAASEMGGSLVKPTAQRTAAGAAASTGVSGTDTGSGTSGLAGAGADSPHPAAANTQRTSHLFAWGIGRRLPVDHCRAIRITSLLRDQGVDLTPAGLEALMGLLDRDGDGSIDQGELAHFLAEWFGPEPDDRDALALAFRAIDIDGDGHVTRDELRRALSDGGSALREAEIGALMELVDLDGNGTLELEELRHALRLSDPGQGYARRSLIAMTGKHIAPVDAPPSAPDSPPRS